MRDSPGPLPTIPTGAEEEPVAVPALPPEATASVVSLLGLEAAAATRYVDEEPLGRGASGTVKAAFDRDLGRRVAVKTSDQPVRSFILEAQTGARLEHPNILPVYDLGIDEQRRLFFTMKHVEGHVTLRELIRRLARAEPASQKVFTFERRAQIVQQVAQALAYAHDRGVSHRDLKPENILLGAAGEVYLADWGISTPAAGGPSERFSGTVAYMSPERLAGGADSHDPEGDVYGLAAVLYELLTLRHHVAEGPTGIRDDMHARLSSNRYVDAKRLADPVHGSVPPALSDICRRALRHDQARRIRSARELSDALQAWLEGDAPVVCPRTALQRVICKYGRFLDRHRLLGPGLTVLALALVIGSLVYTAVSLIR